MEYQKPEDHNAVLNVLLKCTQYIITPINHPDEWA